jgi:cytochrome P450
MDTTSSALARILWLLAQHTEVQDRLRQELCAALAAADGDIPYDDLVALPFMDAVCRETLRLYPPLSQVVKT